MAGIHLDPATIYVAARGNSLYWPISEEPEDLITLAPNLNYSPTLWHAVGLRWRAVGLDRVPFPRLILIPRRAPAKGEPTSTARDLAQNTDGRPIIAAR